MPAVQGPHGLSCIKMKLRLPKHKKSVAMIYSLLTTAPHHHRHHHPCPIHDSSGPSHETLWASLCALTLQYFNVFPSICQCVSSPFLVKAWGVGLPCQIYNELCRRPQGDFYTKHLGIRGHVQLTENYSQASILMQVFIAIFLLFNFLLYHVFSIYSTY